ncbi:hypothetical protein [Streptomyces sp. NPDC058252]|uniref:hypothetical protein n=1 Tax=Streptomyces sp. NPDC058252 TaxID=3346405 RepID=UPI0036F15C2F
MAVTNTAATVQNPPTCRLLGRGASATRASSVGAGRVRVIDDIDMGALRSVAVDPGGDIAAY